MTYRLKNNKSLITTWSNIQGQDASGWDGRKGCYEVSDG